MRRQDLWKLQREAGRVLARLWDAVARPFRGLRTALYDRQRGVRVRLHDGHLPASDRVAIYVIYQPDGVKASTLLACDWLQRHGYAPLVVSNAPVSHRDLANLQARSWLIAERPNLGYDFGGYRDGIWILQRRAQDLSRLVLINDSIWAPLSADTPVLDEGACDVGGMTGPVFVARKGRSRRSAHFQSFFVGFSRAVLNHPAFKRYWQRFPLSSRRRVALAQGEKGLTQTVLAAGFVGAVVPTGQVLLDRLRLEDAETLKLVLTYAADDDPAQADAGRDLLLSWQPTDAWRQSALQHIERVLQRQPPMNAFPVAAIRFLGANVLKKGNNLPIYAAMRWQYLCAVGNGVLPPPAPEILAEIRASQLDSRSDIATEAVPPA